MASGETIRAENRFIFMCLSRFLNERPRAVTQDMVAELAHGGDIAPEEAYALLLSTACGLDAADHPAHRRLYMRYFPLMLKRLEEADFACDPYYQAVRLSAPVRAGAWEMRTETYQPYEAFVQDEPLVLPDGRVIPQLGYFTAPFSFPAVLENGREWMLITPNEINTMRKAVSLARGRVLTYGLGLGYFAYMAARKPEVESVTVVEREAGVIALFEKHILPRLACGDKIHIVQDDAFAYAAGRMGAGGFSVVFTDLWHDPADGVPLYHRMRALEAFSPHSAYIYWIEKTLRLYADGTL